MMLRGLAENHPSADSPVWRPSPLRQAVWLSGLISVCFAAAGMGGAATVTSVGGWYQTLVRPAWTPPGWVFGPVWTALYFLMAVAAWLVWRRDGWPAAKQPLSWFGVQLALNVGWSAVFFGLQLPGAAFGEILVLWLAIAATIIAFWKRSRRAGALLVPYLAWSTFAAVLNAAIWQLNG